MKKDLRSKKVAILVENGFEQVELTEPRAMTSYPSIRTDLRNAGASVVDREVVDQGIVTSRDPRDMPAFNAKMVEEFAERSHAARKAA